MTKRRSLPLIIVASAVMLTAPALMHHASAQTSTTASGGSVVPVVLWAATGAVIGAVAWPMIAGGAVASVAPAGIMSVGSLLNTGAAAGAFVGGAGYLLTR